MSGRLVGSKDLSKRTRGMLSRLAKWGLMLRLNMSWGHGGEQADRLAVAGGATWGHQTRILSWSWRIGDYDLRRR